MTHDNQRQDLTALPLIFCARPLTCCQGWRPHGRHRVAAVALTALAIAASRGRRAQAGDRQSPSGGWLDIHSAARHVDKYRLLLTTQR